jgi:hypothetical protein
MVVPSNHHVFLYGVNMERRRSRGQPSEVLFVFGAQYLQRVVVTWKKPKPSTYFNCIVLFSHTVTRHIYFQLSWNDLTNEQTKAMHVDLTDVGVFAVDVSASRKSIFWDQAVVISPVVI